MTGETEILIRGVGLAVMAVAIGVFLFRQKEGGAQIAIFNHSLAVSRESLVLFTIGVLLLIFPDIADKSKVNVPVEPDRAQLPPAKVVPTPNETVASAQIVDAPPSTSPSSASHDSPPHPSPPAKATSVDPDVLRKEWFEAVSSGDTDRIEQMIATGSVSFKTPIDDQANTALHMAAERCDGTFIRYLLAKGLDPDRHNTHNDSPRHIAMVRCNSKTKVLEAFQNF